MIILDLIQNVALLVALASIYRVFLVRYPTQSAPFRILMGLLFGVAGVVGMMMPIHLLPGAIYDGRSIILSLAGLFGGPLVVAIAAALTIVFRLILGGSGTLAGVLVILMSAAVGLGFRELRRRKVLPVNPPSLLAFGLLVHVLMLAIQQLLPNQGGRLVLSELGLPILVLFPLATLLIGLLFQDAENQARDRKALEESERALVKAQQVAHVGSWNWYIAENRLVWSDEMYRIFGIDRDSFSGDLNEVIARSIHPDDQAAVQESNRLVAEDGRPMPMEYRVVRPNGVVRHVYAEAGELVYDQHGQPSMLSGIVQDITERRAAEEELREGESRYRNLIVHSPDAIFINHDNRVALANEACLKLFGAEREEDLLGRPVMSLFAPTWHEQVQARIQEMRDQNHPVPAAEEQIVRLDGRLVDVDVVAAPFQFRGSSDIHVILRDITERRQMERELAKSHEMLVGLTENVPGVIYTYKLDPDGKSRFPYATSGMWTIYEMTPEEVREDATAVFSRLHPDDYDYVAGAIAESARTLGLFHVVYRVVLPQQGLRWRVSYAKPQRTEDGGTMWYGIIQDTTERKLADLKVQEQLDELRRWQSAMLGRESRIIELKREVNEACAQAGLPPRYGMETPNKTDQGVAR